MENYPKEVGYIDVSPKSEAIESKNWLRDTLVQYGFIFAEIAKDNNVQWDLLQKEPVGRRLINKIRGKQAEDLWGKCLYNYGEYHEADKAVKHRLYVLDSGELVTQREETIIVGPKKGETSYKLIDGQFISSMVITYKEAENVANKIVFQMNLLLENDHIPYIK